MSPVFFSSSNRLSLNQRIFRNFFGVSYQYDFDMDSVSSNSNLFGAFVGPQYLKKQGNQYQTDL